MAYRNSFRGLVRNDKKQTMKELTLKEHLQNIASLGGKARWKDKTAKQRKKHVLMMLKNKKIKKIINSINI